MDILAHGVYNIALQKTIKNKRTTRELWEAFAWGIAPDAVAFGVPLVIGLFLGTFSHHAIVGGYDLAHMIYPYTHSLVIFAVAFLMVYLVQKKWYLPMLGWGLHILFDIPLHTPTFFPTPFLFPVSTYTVPFGIQWSTPVLWIGSWVIVLIWILFLHVRNKGFSHDGTVGEAGAFDGVIRESTVWQNPAIMKIIIQNVPTLDPVVLLLNSRVYYITHNGNIISFITIKSFGSTRELGTAYTSPQFHNKGYLTRLVQYVLNIEPLVYILCRPVLVPSCERLGFRVSLNCGTIINLRRNLYNISTGPLTKTNIVSLKYEKTQLI